jgi:formylglycine-generating enzyme required for sulfatase activity/5-hydroxyisourate hydrolase-like protein (transthyretin family)
MRKRNLFCMMILVGLTHVSAQVTRPLTMVSIPAGTFQMGDTNSAIGAIPVHSVTLGAFTMSQTLVTQEQYVAVMGVNPSYFDSGSTWPVEQVTWYDAALFCNKLSKLAGLDTVYGHNIGDGYTDLIDYTKNGYRLPTEAEYEYAYRAGTTTDYYWGRNYPPTTTADTLAIDSNAVWYGNSPTNTQPVATKKPNAWGLYDMSGNLWEWCNDWYGSYSASSQTNPTGAISGSYRVLRGGSWSNGYGLVDLCSAYRLYFGPNGISSLVGFRVVCGARSTAVLPQKDAAPSKRISISNSAITYELPAASNVSIALYDMQGRQVRQLVNAMQNTGLYRVDISRARVTKGYYIVKFKAGEFVVQKKLALVD